MGAPAHFHRIHSHCLPPGVLGVWCHPTRCRLQLEVAISVACHRLDVTTTSSGDPNTSNRHSSRVADPALDCDEFDPESEADEGPEEVAVSVLRPVLLLLLGFFLGVGFVVELFLATESHSQSPAPGRIETVDANEGAAPVQGKGASRGF